LSSLFSALGITDWEELDVWSRLAAESGRHLDREEFAAVQVDSPRAVPAIWRVWDMASARDLPPSPLRDILKQHIVHIGDVAGRWRRDLHAAGGVHVGI